MQTPTAARQIQTTAADIARQLEADKISDAGWTAWDAFYAAAQADRWASPTATLIANDEMEQAGWIRTRGGWTR